MSERAVVQGIGVSPGAAAGPVVVLAPTAGVDEHEAPCTNPEADGQRVRDALASVASSLSQRAHHATSDTAAEVLLASAVLATDKGLFRAIDKQLARGAGVTLAVHNAVETYAAKFRKIGGMTAERITDLYSIRDRAIAYLLGLPEPGLPLITEPSILVAEDLAPAETATLDREMVLGIVTERGGRTSHTAILAGELGIPAVVQAKGIRDAVANAATITLDGDSGQVIVNPTEAELREVETPRFFELEDVSYSSEGLEIDGRPITLLANVGSVEEAERLAATDIAGIGLFRTEFLYLNRQTAPSVEEQTEAYTRVLKAFGERRVVVRTFDAGSDKPLPFIEHEKEDNPALGCRGIRLYRVHEELIRDQLQALSNAINAVEKANLWVMAPMITTVEETQWFVDLARTYVLPKVGVMIETPAATIMSDQILAAADFASIGTNDLTQYTMAADRTKGDLAELSSPWQPAVLRLIKAIAEVGEKNGKSIGVCGEASGDPLMALVLVGLGVSSLSMAPGKIRAVHAALRLHDVQDCQRLASRALQASTAKEARATVCVDADPISRALL